MPWLSNLRRKRNRDHDLDREVAFHIDAATRDYEAWSARLLNAQIGFVTPTTWEGETVARFAFLHPNTTVEMVDEILGSMVQT